MSDSSLPCGVAYDDLLTQVADGAAPPDSAHQRTCPYCRALLAELETLWRPVQRLAAEDVRAPSTLLSAVMARVSELSRHPWHAVITTELGETRIAARVIAAVARLAAVEVPSVTLALGGGRTSRDSSAAEVGRAQAASTVGVAGSHVVVDVAIAVEMGASIHTVADQVRDHLTRRVADQVGLTPAEVNVDIVDVSPAAT